jgi:hypothetical protein
MKIHCSGKTASNIGTAEGFSFEEYFFLAR